MPLQIMVACNIARHSLRGRHGLLWQQPSWRGERQIGGIMGRPGRGFVGLTAGECMADEPAGVDVQMGREPCRPVENDGGVSAHTVSELCQQGQVTKAVEALGVLVQMNWGASQSLLYDVLKGCATKKDLVMGRRVHGLIVENGYELDTFLCNHILRMYASHGRLQEAMDVFTVVAEPNAFMWSSMISAHVQHGQAKHAVELYHQMRRSSVEPDGHVFLAALQACGRAADLKSGQQVHADVLASGVEPKLFVLNSLVDMYAKCDSLQEARRVFDRLPQKDVVTWNVMIAGYSQQGMSQEALRLYDAMQEEGVTGPNSVTFVSLLQACASLGSPALETGKQLHAQMVEQGVDVSVTVANSLVNMYAKCGSLADAQAVFEAQGQKDVVTWTSLIAGYSQQGMALVALELYSRMQEEGIAAPNSVTFVCLLQACAMVGAPALERGKQLHAQIGERGLDADVVVANGLVNMYAKCGSLEDAELIFYGLRSTNVITWTALIAGYARQGMGQEALRLFSAMQEEGIAAPDPVTFVSLLQACANVGAAALNTGKQVHAQIGERVLQVDGVVGSSLINMYAKCGSLEDARSVFDGLREKDVVTWNAMIAGYSQQSMGEEAFHLYRTMQDEAISKPNSVTFVCLLQACASLGTAVLEWGKQLHSQIGERGLEADAVVANSLVHMYAKCGSLQDAQCMFDRLLQKDVVTWNTMIAGYSQQGMGQEALQLYSAMQEEGMSSPNSGTFVCLLQACASLGPLALERGKELHEQIREQGLQADLVVGSSLVDMYAKCGNLQEAHTVFHKLDQKNLVTWTALIAGYSQQGMGQEALCLYGAMQEEGITAPDSVMFACLLQACADVADLHLGRQLHSEIKERGLQADVFVAISLMNMYAKSGSLVDAQQVFDALPKRDAVSWNALIAGYTRQGDSDVVFDLIDRMREEGIQPDNITFISILSVCSHVGLVNKGREYFLAMSDFGITPTMEHYTCMVDLLGRVGRLDEALAVARTMPVLPDTAVWHTLLGACRKWGNVEVGLHAFDEAVKLDEKDVAAYVSMSNIYADAQMWEQARKMQARRMEVGAWKLPGRSWWTDKAGQVHSFVAGDSKHPESNGIYAKLEQLLPEMKKRIDLSQVGRSD